MNPYKHCPIYRNERYCLRLIEETDAEDLLPIYSDKKAAALCNSDNCEADFYYPDLQQMRRAVEYWLLEYRQEGFIRWTILDTASSTACGTMEVFKRTSNDVYNNMAVLRLDLSTSCENTSCIRMIMNLILPHIGHIFHCRHVITKCTKAASERLAALQELGFSSCGEPLIGWDGTLYGDYYICPLLKQ